MHEFVIETDGLHDDVDVVLDLLHGVALGTHVHQVQHGELLQVVVAVGFGPEAGADLEEFDRSVRMVPELPHDVVEVDGMHGAETALVIHPEDLLVERMVLVDGHLGEFGLGDEDGGLHLYEPFLDEGLGELELQFHQAVVAGVGDHVADPLLVLLLEFGHHLGECLVAFRLGLEFALVLRLMAVLSQTLYLWVRQFACHGICPYGLCECEEMARGRGVEPRWLGFRDPLIAGSPPSFNK